MGKRYYAHSNASDHTQGTDQGLDTGGANAVTAAQAKAAVTASHTQGTDTTLVVSTGLSDGQYSGLIEAGTLGATVAFGELCYFNFATSKWLKAKGDAAATSSGKLGFCVLAGDDTDTSLFLLRGNIRANAIFPTFTAGPVYISAATAGAVTSTAPSGTADFVVRVVGFANTGDELSVDISPDYVTITGS